MPARTKTPTPITVAPAAGPFKPTYPDNGLSVSREFTQEGADPFDGIEFTTSDVKITDATGATVTAMDGVEVPVSWSPLATKILASKYLRKAGVPQLDEQSEPIVDDEGNPVTGPETSAKQAVLRIANAFTLYGQRGGYFRSQKDAVAYRDELAYMMITQVGANNSPVWFNVGLHEAYGIVEDAEGNWYWDPDTGQTVESPHKYYRANVNACYILGIDDNLVGDGGIFSTIVNESRLFKGGSGAGGNWSKVRAKGEQLTGGGESSGVMSFLKVADVGAGSIKSGGTTRRAAKMVILDADHPEIEDFIWAKAIEEEKVPFLEQAGYSTAWNAENGAYSQLFYQNANHSVRIPRGFMDARYNGDSFDLTWRRNGAVARTVDAGDLWHQIAEASWRSADPGLQFDELLNDWNTAANDAPLRGSNPCSEYTHIDDTACNLASMNLVKFEREGSFDAELFRHATRLWTVTLELAVVMSHYPSEAVARNSFEHRTLGLGYANIGALLMRSGLPYDSDEGRAVMGALTAIMHTTAYATSAEMAGVVGPCAAYSRNEEHVRRVLHNHRRAAYGSRATDAVGGYEQLTVTPDAIDHEMLATTRFAALSDVVIASADEMMELAGQNGVRNMQATVLAPTGTIGLLMDCDTTGIEPDFSLVKYKTLAGGGAVKIVNQSVKVALERLGYSDDQVADMVTHVIGTGTLSGDTPVNAAALSDRGVPADAIARVEEQLDAAMSLRSAFHPAVLGEDALVAAGMPVTRAQDPDLDVLGGLGFADAEIEQSSNVICGFQNLEAAPHLKAEHLPVFDCANYCGPTGTRAISWQGHVGALGATAPFLSGAASKTVNLPAQATVEDVESAHDLAYQRGVKAVAIYRDGSKLSQPLTSESKKTDVEADTDGDVQVVERVVTEGDVPAGMSPTGWYNGHGRPPKFRLPGSRTARVEKFEIGSFDMFLTAGEYEDGTLGEIFIDLSKEGSTLKAMCSAFATAVSMGLQRGVPLEEFVEKFRGHQFEPNGVVSGHPNLKMANSLLDAIFRQLGYRYLGRNELVHAPSEVAPTAASVETPAGTAGTVEIPQSISEMLADTPVTTPAPETNGNDRGFAGALTKTCTECGGTMYQNGVCFLCRGCGATTGCS